jgi:hypothetical protein
MKHPGRIFLIAYCCTLFASALVQAEPTEILYLSGTDKDHTVNWEFFCTSGMNSGRWTTIPVPSNWELQGFGSYDYGDKPSYQKGHETGLYRYRFRVPAGWKGKHICIVFEGSMTDTEVKINGKSAGEKHQGAFYRFRYDVSNLLVYGMDNLLEAKVSKMSSDSLVNEAENNADYWVFGGIYRPVYLEALPPAHISHAAIDARADGNFKAIVYLNREMKEGVITARIIDGSGIQVGSVIPAEMQPDGTQAILKATINNPDCWSPEQPSLYRVEFTLSGKKESLHTIKESFGFRTIEVRAKDGIYLNGIKIRLKGVCRHSFWPASGRTTSRELSIQDVNYIKDMNMNAVRMSHYPPDVHFLDACDSLGLLVLDELAGWQRPPYSTIIGKKLVKEMVERDVNHPCIIFWDNGNEGGFNHALDSEFGRYDIQERKVLHPWGLYSDINTQHYIPYDYGVNTAFHGDDIFLPTEFLHGLYDGGAGAGLEDYWKLMLDNPLCAGGFLWAFCDEGVVRTDRNGWIDTYGNQAPDGILGPYREKEASFYTIRDIWSPMDIEKIQITPYFDGILPVQNRFYFTNLKDCSLRYTLRQFDPSFDTNQVKEIVKEIISPHIVPGGQGEIKLNLPADWQEYDVMLITAFDPAGREVFCQSWPIRTAKQNADKWNISMAGNLTAIVEPGRVTFPSATMQTVFSLKTGMLESLRQGGQICSLGKGPILLNSMDKPDSVWFYPSGKSFVLEALWKGSDPWYFRWTVLPDGWLQLDYRYRQEQAAEFMGVSFSYPDTLVKYMKWIGNGPYRVWKNRMKGGQFGLWQKTYNNTVTGESWQYPEFKGYHSDFRAAEIGTCEGRLTILSGSDHLFLRMLTPDPPKGAFNKNTNPPFPPGDISFLHAIPPIGTKFSTAGESGPQGQLSQLRFDADIPPLEGTLYFRFDKQ